MILFPVVIKENLLSKVKMECDVKCIEQRFIENIILQRKNACPPYKLE